MKSIATIAMAGLLAVSVAGCTPREQNATLLGGGIGAAVGGLASKSLGGAAVGGALGAGTGFLIAKNTTRCWKENFLGHRYLGWCRK